MKYVKRFIELENNMEAVGHFVTDAENKRVLIHGLSEEVSVTDRIIRATEKSLSDRIGLLVIQEAGFSVNEGRSTV